MFEFENKVAIKICGLTNPDDALACAAAGVEMIGLNFSPRSARCITLATGAKIVTTVRRQFARINFVGVFVDQDRAFVQTIATDLALDAVQFHGEETAEVAATFAATTGIFVIKALRVASELPVFAAYAERCDAILLDTWSASTPGGTGESFPWPLAASLRPIVRRLILAGGLTSENVTEAIRLVRPWAVDVCSGVEFAPGRKDEAKVRAFVRVVERSNHEKIPIRA